MMETQSLDWKKKFKFKNMVRIGIDGDGSCYFNAIAYAYFIPYREGNIDGTPLDRRKFIRNLRYDLAEKLKEHIDPNDDTSPRNYDLLSRGNLANFSENVIKKGPTNLSYGLDDMVTELQSGNDVGYVYNEFVSNEFEKDIYFLDYNSNDVYVVGDDFDLYYLRRPSIVLLSIPGHFELVGIQKKEGIQTLFSPDDPFIEAIKLRMREKIIQGSSNINLYE